MRATLLHPNPLALLVAGGLACAVAASGCLCSKPSFDAPDESNYVAKDTGNDEPLNKARVVLPLDTPRGFAVDDKFVYFFEGTTLLKIPFTASEGDEKTPVCSDVEPGPGPRIGGNYLYWAVSSDTEVKIMAVAKGGGPQTKAAVTKPLVRDIGGDASGIFWISFPGGNDKGHEGVVYRLGSPGEQPTSIATNLAYPNLLAVDPSGSDLYFTTIEGPVVSRVPKKGGALAVLEGAKEWTQAIAATGKWVYWVRDKQIMRVTKSGGTAKNVATENDAPLALIGDDHAIYWATQDGLVKRLADDSEKPKIIARDQKRIDQLGINANAVFWETKSAILSVPK